MEGWHGVIKKSFGGSHLSIFKFISALITEQKYQESRMAKIDSGSSIITKRKTEIRNKKLLKLIEEYSHEENFNLKNYLNGISHNISF